MGQKNPSLSESFFWIDIKLPARVSNEAAGNLLDALNDWALSATALRENNNHRADWHLRWMVEGAPDHDQILLRLALALQISGVDIAIGPEDIRIEPVPDIDWLAHSYSEFAPFSIGDFFVHGSHYSDDIPAQKIPLQIDAATAFGSGEHGTTAGCLEALQDLKREDFKPRQTLDLGTGSGILAIAAWKLWGTPVVATDIDEEAVRVTEEHARLNGVPLDPQALTAETGDGFDTATLKSGMSFDLVIANILAGPLVALSEDISSRTGPGGCVLLSGMLHEQADEVADAYRAHGLTLRKRYRQGDWTSLLLQKQ